MPFQFVHSIIAWLLKRRKHQIDLFLKYPYEVQKELLNRLLYTAENTEIGKKYDFSTIENYETFSQRIPIQQYESIEPLIERVSNDSTTTQKKIYRYAMTPAVRNALSNVSANARSSSRPISTSFEPDMAKLCAVSLFFFWRV